jgi:hypothetical protein
MLNLRKSGKELYVSSVAVLVIGGDVWWNKDLLDDLASDVLGVAEE